MSDKPRKRDRLLKPFKRLFSRSRSPAASSLSATSSLNLPAPGSGYGVGGSDSELRIPSRPISRNQAFREPIENPIRSEDTPPTLNAIREPVDTPVKAEDTPPRINAVPEPVDIPVRSEDTPPTLNAIREPVDSPVKAEDAPPRLNAVPEPVDIAVRSEGTRPRLTDERSAVVKNAISVFQGFTQLVRLMKPVLEAAPFASGVVGVIEVIADAVELSSKSDEEAESTLALILDRLKSVEDALLRAKDESQSSQETSQEFARFLIKQAQALADHVQKTSRLQRLVDGQGAIDLIRGLVTEIERKTVTFQIDITLAIERNTRSIMDDLRRMEINGWLKTPEAIYNTDTIAGVPARSACTEGTRVPVLAKIMDWVRDEDAAPIFWLHGMAGSGKSTIAFSICEQVTSTALGASFFCSRQVPNLRSAGRIVPTIVAQLANHSSSFAAALKTADHGAFYRKEKQIPELLVKPWQASSANRSETLPPTLIVIDALDEIEGGGGGQFLEGLFQAVGSASSAIPGLKFLVTSRPHPDIKAMVFEHLPPSAVFRIEDISQEESHSDIQSFLSFKLDGIANTDHIATLTCHANSLFIHAATVARYILPPPPPQLTHKQKIKRLTAAINSGGSLHENVGNPLDLLYSQVIEEALLQVEGQKEHLLCILHTIIVAFRPLSSTELARLIDQPTSVDADTIELFVAALHAVLLTSNDHIYSYHKSFSDFLLDSNRSKELACGEQETHLALTLGCLDTLTKQLRFNICHLESSFLLDKDVNLPLLVKKHISPELQYACYYWVNHLVEIAVLDSSLETELLALLEQKGLFLIEVVNLLDARFVFLNHMNMLDLWCKTSISSALKKIISSLTHLGRYFFNNGLSDSTPHLYISALPMMIASDAMFPPSWQTPFTGLPKLEGVENRTGQNIVLSFDNNGPVRSCALSSDGQYLLATTETSIIIWNTANGQQVQKLEGHTAKVNSVGFSTDGRYVVSGSDDYSVCIWDTATGQQIQKLEGHTGKVQSVGFSTDGRYVVSGSSNHSVCIWNTATGQQIQELEGHTDWLQSVGFSTDGRYVISGSDDQSVRIWDTATGQQIQKLEGHTDQVNSVGFSTDGRCVVSGSGDKSVRIWDTATGQQIQELEGHTDWVRSVGFSTDGRYVVSGSDDYSVCIWDTATGQQVQKLEGHTGWVWSVGFSTDGRYVISGSDDQSVRIWDTTAGQQIQKLEGHTNWVRSVGFSTDGRYVVSGSDDYSVCIWDTATGQQIQKLEGHTDKVQSVRFSTDGRYVVSGSDDYSVCIWDTATGQQIQKLEDHTGKVQSVGFSTDGRYVVSGSSNHSVCIWDTATGQQIQKLEGHTDWVQSVGFSTDSRYVVSGSDDQSVRIWDTTTGQQIQKLEGHTDWVRSVGFSTDGRYVVSSSSDHSVCIWDTATCQQIQKLEGHTRWVRSVGFSTDGRYVVSGSDDQSVRIWDTTTGQQIQKLEGHTNWVQSVGFSTDGRYMVSGSNDASIRIFDLITNEEINNLYSLLTITPASICSQQSDNDKDQDQNQDRDNQLQFLSDGWLNTGSQHVFWIHPSLVPTLCCDLFYQKLCISAQGSASLTLSSALLGPQWTQIYSQS